MNALLLARAVTIAALPVIAALPAAPRTGQEPPLAVTADPAAGYRPVLRLAGALGDPGLDEAARAGLPVRVRIRVELWRDRFLDQLAGSESWSAVIAFEPLDRRYLVHTRAGPQEQRGFATYDEARAALDDAFRPALRPARPGRYYYLAILEVETLSLSDLDELEHWLRGELQPAVRGEESLPDAVSGGARRLLVRILGLPALRFEARSARFRTP